MHSSFTIRIFLIIFSLNNIVLGALFLLFTIFRMKEALKAFPLVYVEMEPGDARDCPRFFDQVGHQTIDASIENKYFFTK